MKTARGTEQVRYVLRQRLEQRASPAWRRDLCGCVDELVLLMDESHTRPMRDLSHCVRDLIVQQCMTGAGRCTHDHAELDDHVRLVLDAMEHARRNEIDRGEWDSTPVPPQMYG